MGIDHCDLDQNNLLIIRCLLENKSTLRITADSGVIYMGENHRQTLSVFSWKVVMLTVSITVSK